MRKRVDIYVGSCLSKECHRRECPHMAWKINNKWNGACHDFYYMNMLHDLKNKAFMGMSLRELGKYVKI